MSGESDFRDTVAALVASLTGTDDADRQQRIFGQAGNKPSDYGRAVRAILAHLCACAEFGRWPSMETINDARKMLGRPPMPPEFWHDDGEKRGVCFIQHVHWLVDDN
jgi:hypothetical protein